MQVRVPGREPDWMMNGFGKWISRCTSIWIRRDHKAMVDKLRRKRATMGQNLPKQDFIQMKGTKRRNQTIMIRRMRSELKVMLWRLIRRQVRHFKLF